MNIVFFDLEEQRPLGFLTVEEAAEKWYQTEKAIRQAISRGSVKSVKVLGRRFVLDDEYDRDIRDPIVMFGKEIL